MSWIPPKTDWVKGYYFNVDPDYLRIKGNAEELGRMVQKIVPSFVPTTLDTVTVATIPGASFFQNIVNAVRREIEAITPSGEGYDIDGMGDYTDAGEILAFCAENLAAIESNMKILYDYLTLKRPTLGTLDGRGLGLIDPYTLGEL